MLLKCTILQLYFSFSYANEMTELGKAQYQLLQERANLPQYGSCWKQAIQHVHESCKTLSEETQSNIALHLTNCFLEMSGHETYTCEYDKKPNLRGICISSMSDRAFNVYTEFYTHTQNICWFLQGQIWHEVLAESTHRVGLQLELSARNQESLLKAQKESLDIQERLLNQGLILGRVVEEVTRGHEKILDMLNWFIREMSWFDSLIFYIISVIFIIVFTSIRNTKNARLMLLILLFICFVSERYIQSLFVRIYSDQTATEIHNKIVVYVWFWRYSFIFVSFVILMFSIYFYKDYLKVNNSLLESIYKQNKMLLNFLIKNDPDRCSKNGDFSIISEIPTKNGFECHSNQSESDFGDSKLNNASCNLNLKSPLKANQSFSNKNDISVTRNVIKKSKARDTPVNILERKYNLRSRDTTPA